MGYTRGRKFYLPIGFSGSNPLDSTEYRFYNVSDPLTVPSLYPRFYAPEKLTFTGCYINITSDTDCSNDTFVVYLRELTGGVDTAIGTVTKSGNKSYYVNNPTLAAPGVKDLSYQFKLTTPAWATNPTNFRGNGFLEYMLG